MISSWVVFFVVGGLVASLLSFACGYSLCRSHLQSIARHCLHRRDVFRLFGDPWPPSERSDCKHCDIGGYTGRDFCSSYPTEASTQSQRDGSDVG